MEGSHEVTERVLDITKDDVEHTESKGANWGRNRGKGLQKRQRNSRL